MENETITINIGVRYHSYDGGYALPVAGFDKQGNKVEIVYDIIKFSREETDAPYDSTELTIDAKAYKRELAKVKRQNNKLNAEEGLPRVEKLVPTFRM